MGLQPKATDDQICDFIVAYQDRNGYSPCIRDICAEFGYSAPSAVKFRLDRMRERGMVDFVDRVPRTLRVVGR